MDEVMEMADRIIVMHEGEIMGEFATRKQPRKKSYIWHLESKYQHKFTLLKEQLYVPS